MLRKLEIRCFRGMTKTLEFGKHTLITAGNGRGKTTTLDAIRWCFVGVDGDDKTNNNIFDNRKQLEEGAKETVSVRCTFTDDGIDTVFERIATRKGDKVEYSYKYGDIDVSAKKYGECVEGMFIPVPQLKFILNVRRWDLLDESTLRKALMGLADEKTLICDEAYREIKDKIEVAGIEETKKQLRKEIKTLQSALDSVQIELNMVEQAIPELIDLGELPKRLEERELELKRLEESPSEVPAELQEKIREEVRAIAELEAKYEDAVQEHHLNYTMRLQELKTTYAEANENVRAIDRIKAQRESDEAVIENGRRNMEELRKEYDDVLKRSFEGACPCCGRPYEGEQRESLRAEHMRKKDEMLSKIKQQAKRIKDNVEAAKESIARCDAKYAEIKNSDPSAVLNEIKRLEATGESAFATTEKGSEMLAAIEQAKASRTDVSEYDKGRVNLITGLRDEIFSLKMQFNDAERLTKEREAGLAKAAEVKARQAELVKKQSTAERLLDLTVRYEIALLQGLQDYINDMLGAGGNGYDIHLSLYYTDGNGEVHTQCKVVADGVYDTINNSKRGIVGLRMAEAFVNRSGKEIPILIDNVEAFDKTNVPYSSHQLIVTMVDLEGGELKLNNIQK